VSRQGPGRAAACRTVRTALPRQRARHTPAGSTESCAPSNRRTRRRRAGQSRRHYRRWITYKQGCWSGETTHNYIWICCIEINLKWCTVKQYCRTISEEDLGSDTHISWILAWQYCAFPETFPETSWCIWIVVSLQDPLIQTKQNTVLQVSGYLFIYHRSNKFKGGNHMFRAKFLQYRRKSELG
jgi:hypothetical protein